MANNIKKIEVKNIFLPFIFRTLTGMQLEGAQSAARRRFNRAVRPFLVELEAEQDELQRKLCDKDDKGEPKVFNDSFVFTAKNRKEFEKKGQELSEQTIIIDVLPSNEKDIATVAEIFAAEAKKLTKDKYTATEYDFVETLNEVVEVLNSAK